MTYKRELLGPILDNRALSSADAEMLASEKTRFKKLMEGFYTGYPPLRSLKLDVSDPWLLP